MSIESQQVLIQLQEKALFFGVWRSCLNCYYWRPNQNGAGPSTQPACIKFHTIPPLKVIVLSCEEWLPVVPI